MNRYVLVNEYIGKETCERCGKAIKSIYVVHDNIENKDIHVGMKCIEHVMNLNESFAKALVKELEKYSKLHKSIVEFDADKEVKKLRKQLEKFHNGVITKENKYYGSHIWDIEKQCHRAETLEEFDNDYKKYYQNRIEVNEINKKDLQKLKEKLNNFSKKGLIDLK